MDHIVYNIAATLMHHIVNTRRNQTTPVWVVGVGATTSRCAVELVRL
jgi:hypothetical protein